MFLETNVYRNEGLGAHVSNAEVVRTLLNELPRLKAVIAHGSVANAFVCRLQLPPYVRCFPMPSCLSY